MAHGTYICWIRSHRRLWLILTGQTQDRPGCCGLCSDTPVVTIVSCVALAIASGGSGELGAGRYQSGSYEWHSTASRRPKPSSTPSLIMPVSCLRESSEHRNINIWVEGWLSCESDALVVEWLTWHWFNPCKFGWELTRWWDQWSSLPASTLTLWNIDISTSKGYLWKNAFLCDIENTDWRPYPDEWCNRTNACCFRKVWCLKKNCDEFCETQETGALMSDGRILAHFKSDKEDT